MTSNMILFGWNRSVPGREATSAQHFQDFVAYLGELVQAGTIQSFEPYFLDPHSGDLNGFFIIKGEGQKLDGLLVTKEWVTHTTRAFLHLDGLGIVRGTTGEGISERMAIWTEHIPT